MTRSLFGGRLFVTTTLDGKIELLAPDGNGKFIGVLSLDQINAGMLAAALKDAAQDVQVQTAQFEKQKGRGH